ncbi:hypothetical protein F2Q69_00052853 [Brassica cretica]|uniref:Uncharacterized protein n=1 Tax=Brassica cretica TaxID=69181 RepID=A0A8S9MVI9_BRACR|nr:hypothetical protein F2Q69_00052853 [Brassica cretica]
MISRRINDPGIIAACHCADEYETEYSESIETHAATSIDSDQYDDDYEEERAIEYKAILDEEDNLLHHSSWKRNAPSIDRTSWPSIDTQPHQRYQKRSSTDIAYYKSIDTDFNRVRDEDYSIGSWADEHHHESFAVETVTYTPGADKLQDSFTDRELLNMQKRDDTDLLQAEAEWERTRFSESIDTRHQQSIDKTPQQSIDINNNASIDNRLAAAIDTNPPRPNTVKSQTDLHTREEIDQLVEGIYRAVEITKERLDGRCDDIYYPMDLTISSLTSKVEAIQGELMEIQSYIARQPEASISIDKRINISIDANQSASIDSNTNRG